MAVFFNIITQGFWIPEYMVLIVWFAENTEEHLIKGKKVQGVGLGNIFGDGPIKLRKTGDKKPGERPTEPPKVGLVERRSHCGGRTSGAP